MTAVDNSAALAATTAAEAMPLSAYNCDKGDDAPCVTQYGAGACCFMAVVQTAGADPAADLSIAVSGWPTAKDEENYFCLDAVSVGYYGAFNMAYELTGEDGSDATWTQTVTQGSYKGYCVSAMKIAASVSAAATAMFVASFWEWFFKSIFVVFIFK